MPSSLYFAKTTLPYLVNIKLSSKEITYGLPRIKTLTAKIPAEFLFWVRKMPFTSEGHSPTAAAEAIK